MNEEERQRILKAGFTKFKQAVDAGGPKEIVNPFDELIAKLVLLDGEVRDQVRPIVQAGGGRDPRSMEHLLHNLYCHALSKWAKIELEQTAAWMLTSVAMQSLYPKELGVKPKL